MNLHRRSWVALLAAAALSCLAASPALALSTRAVAYVPEALNTAGAYIFDWSPAGRADVINDQGKRSGNVASSGAQRVVTLDTPFSVQYTESVPDCSGGFEDVEQRSDTLQFGVTLVSGTDNRGTSAVVSTGTVTQLTGCNAGNVVPFGALSDPGLATSHLALRLRPSIGDLVPGVALAGTSEQDRAGDPFPAVDVMTLLAGSQVQFAATGNVYGMSIVDGWLVLALPGGDRAYTRITVDRRSGAEVWLDADWVAGQPANVTDRLMVKPAAGAGFGTLRQASRMWNSGLFAASRTPFYIYLYQNGTGERISIDLDAGTETRTPITSWSFVGPDLVQVRPGGSGITRERTWAPLRNGGGRSHFVLEDEAQVAADGTRTVIIKTRVNFYVDTGAAVPPPVPTRR